MKSLIIKISEKEVFDQCRPLFKSLIEEEKLNNNLTKKKVFLPKENVEEVILQYIKENHLILKALVL